MPVLGKTSVWVGAFGVLELQIQDYWSLLFLLPRGLFVVPQTFQACSPLRTFCPWCLLFLECYSTRYCQLTSSLSFTSPLKCNLSFQAELLFFPTQFFSITLTTIWYEIQLTVEQHGFELRGSTYMWSFSVDLYPVQTHVQGSTPWLGIRLCRGTVIVIFPLYLCLEFLGGCRP